MARPNDWNILDLDHDPTPGDPWRIKELAKRLQDLGDEAERAARDVRGLAGDPAAMNWIGAAGDEFRNQIGKFPGQLDKVATSHHMCAAALLEFGNSLDTHQSTADRALSQARPLHDQVQRIQAQLHSASADLTSANKGVDAAHAASTVDPTAVTKATQSQTDAKTAVDSLNQQLSGPASQLETLKKLAHSAEDLRHGDEDTARTKINAATDAGIPPDSFWHKLGEIAGAIWKGLVIVAKIVSFVGAIVLMVVGGPLWLIVAVVVAGLIILADTLYKYSQGKASLWDVGLAVLGCIPITKGLTTLSALGDAFRAGGLLGAGAHLGAAALVAGKGLLSSMGSLLKGGGGMLRELFAGGGELSRAMAWNRRVIAVGDAPLKFAEMSPKARQLYKALQVGNGIADVASGEVNLSHLADLTSHAGREFAVVQNAAGDLKLIQGSELGTSIPRELKGYRFTIHSHPEPSKPGVPDYKGDHTMKHDFDWKKSPHVEAVVSQNGDVTFFDNKGFVEPPDGMSHVPGGPVNGWGHIVSMLGIK